MIAPRDIENLNTNMLKHTHLDFIIKIPASNKNKRNKLKYWMTLRIRLNRRENVLYKKVMKTLIILFTYLNFFGISLDYIAFPNISRVNKDYSQLRKPVT